MYSVPIPLLQGNPEPPLPAPVVAPPAAQIGAVCWRLRKGQAEVLLVTSRDTGRWVIPKGWPIAGLTPQAAAEREAWEEAGVQGKISPLCLGQYCYEKLLPHQVALPCAVQVFPLRVQSLRASFPERQERRRKWFTAEAASLLVAEPDLAELLLHLSTEPQILAPNARRAKKARAASLHLPT